MDNLERTGKNITENYNAKDKDTYTSAADEVPSWFKEKKTTVERPKRDYLLRLNETHTEAFLTLYWRSGNPFTMEEILALLQENGVTHGIIKETLIEFAEGKYYYEEVLIAQGTTAKDGKDGFFEYHFNIHPETRPIILPDGTVDYNVLGKIELVKCGDLLATYHPAIPGVVGRDIHGNVVDAYVGKDLPPLKCKNCELDGSTGEYHAAVEGNVTLEDNKLTVTPVYFVDGNLDAATGNVNFYGDVLVNGDVFAGVTVKATGNITVTGHVQTANLIAGKDVILQNGMQGAGSSTIYAGRNVMARFLEQMQVYAGNEVNTSTALNCRIESGNIITITGEKGTIIGGTAMAVEEISTAFIGNHVGVKTNIVIGLEKDLQTTIAEIDSNIENNQVGMEEAMNTLERIAYQLQTQPLTPEINEQRAEQTRKKIQCQSQIKELSTRRIQVIDIAQRSMDGRVVVNETVFAGSVVTINGAQEKIQSEFRNVTFRKYLEEIRVVSNKLQ